MTPSTGFKRSNHLEINVNIPELYCNGYSYSPTACVQSTANTVIVDAICSTVYRTSNSLGHFVMFISVSKKKNKWYYLMENSFVSLAVLTWSISATCIS